MKSKMRLHPDVVISVVTLIFSAVLLFEIREYPDDVKMFPSIFLYLFVAFMAITLVQGIRKSLTPDKVDQSEFWCKFETIKNPAITAGFVVIYVALINILGFYISTILYLCVAMYYFGSKNWKINIPVAIGVVIFCYLLFEMALSVTLPVGMLLEGILG